MRVFASEFSHLEYDEREWETINYLFDHSGGEVTFDNLDVRSSALQFRSDAVADLAWCLRRATTSHAHG